MRRAPVLSALAAASASLALLGCGARLQIDRGAVVTVANLGPENYEIVGDVEGVGSVTYVLLVFPIGSEPKGGVLYNPFMPMPFAPPPGTPSGMAIYNAIESNPGVDMVIAPRFESTVKGFPPLFWTTTVKVKGKGVRLK